MVLNQSVLVRGSLFMGMVIQDRNSWAALIRSIGFAVSTRPETVFLNHEGRVSIKLIHEFKMFFAEI